MAKALPTFLTRRKKAHALIANLQYQRVRFLGWKEARAAFHARKKAELTQ